MNMKTKMYKAAFIWCLAFLISSTALYSQVDEIQFEKISIESGLSQSTILSMYQDSRGFLWFGTFEGLNRFDGYSFKVFKTDPKDPLSLSSNNIGSILEDHVGVLWIGTEDGLNQFDRQTERFTRYKNDPQDSKSLSNNYIRSVYEDGSGIIWIATRGGGLNRYDRETKQFTHYRNDPGNQKSISNNNIFSIIEDDQEYLWVGTEIGLNHFRKQTGECVRYIHDPHNPHSLSFNAVWRLCKDRANNLWLGTWGGGLNMLDVKRNRFIRYQNNPIDPTSLSHNVIRAIYEDRDGTIWVGTDGGGLDRFIHASDPLGTGKFIRYKNILNDPTSISGNSIISILQDRLGILWIGTNYNGINKYNPAKKKFSVYKNRFAAIDHLSKITVDAIYEDHKSVLWIGTNDEGLIRFDRKKNEIDHFTYNRSDPHSLSNDVVRCICEDRYQRLWIGTDDGLNRFDSIRKNFTVFKTDAGNTNSLSNSTIFSLYRDKTGTLWVGTTVGLNRFDDKKEKFTRYLHDPRNPNSISDNYIWTIIEDSSGVLNIGTQLGGLNRFDPFKGTCISYQQSNQNLSSISSNKILCLHYDHTNALWIGTTNGLNKFDIKTGIFHRYTEKDGLPNNTIQGILEDTHSNLWIGTNHGLSQFNPGTAKFRNYFESSGLQSNEFSPNACTILKSGEMAFGGADGFTLFHPDSISDDLSVPAVVLTDFQIINKPVPIGINKDGRTILPQSISECDAITLSYEENVFSFEFAGLHYASPKDNLYAYMMEGFEKEWNYSTANRRFVPYTNLNPGTYVFRVKASNSDGVWNEVGTSLRITITPPYWKTAWFRIGAIFLVLGLLVAGYKIRTARIRSRNRELERHIVDRTVQLETANKELEAFSYSVSHDLRAPLRSIDGFSIALLEDYSNKLDEKGKDYLHRVCAASKHMEQLIDDILNLSRVMRTEMLRTSVDLSSLAQTITNDLMRTQPNRKITFLITPGMLVHADRNLMGVVLENLFDNAWKFSSKHPTATIEFGCTTNQGQTVFFVKDDGDGFEMAYAGKLFVAFQRMHASSKFEGTGIGLTTVQRIIHRHGGKVWAEAEKDKGATFYFTVPS